MNPFIMIILLLTFSLFQSCMKPVKQFSMDQQMKHTTLELYADGTFVEYIKEAEDSYEFSGNWEGSFEEDSIFTTQATKNGFQNLTTIPTKRYLIQNDSSILLNNPLEYTIDSIEKTGTEKGWLLTEFLDLEKVERIKISNVNGSHYLSHEQWQIIKIELNKARSVGGLRCKPSGPCLTFELESGKKIHGCICGDLINFESDFEGSFRIVRKMNFNNF